MRNLIRGVLLLTAGALLLLLRAAENTPVAAFTTAQAAPATRSVSTVSYNGQEFLSAFNSARAQARLVLVFSPT